MARVARTGRATTMRFADRRTAGEELAPLVAQALAGSGGSAPGGGTLLLGVTPGGVPVAAEVARRLGVEVIELPIDRTDSGVDVRLPVEMAGRTVVVVDDGVETGTAAAAVATALRAAGVARSVLAVPVCPRDVEATLLSRYDEIVAVVRPLGRRALRWHYVTF